MTVLIAVAAITGKVLLKGGVATGAMAGYLAATAGRAYLNQTPEGRALTEGVGSIVLDPDAFLRPYRDSSAAFFAAQGARATAFGLTAFEQDQVLSIRRQLVDALTDDACAAAFWRGTGTVDDVMGPLPETTRSRLGYLTGRGMARVFLDLPIHRGPPDEAAAVEVIQRYAYPAELEVIGTADGASTAGEQCYAVRLLYEVAQRPPPGTAERELAVHWVLSLGVTP